jgi:arylsulfatase A-like enzyme
MSPPAAAPRPNLLVVFSDQQHGHAAGWADSRFATPHLNRLAAESVNFTHAFCTTPQCSPSRSSLLTGLYPSKTGVWSNVGASGGAPLSQPTVGTALQADGYRTAYFGKWHLGKEPQAVQGWTEDFGVTGPETTNDEEATDRAVDFLRRAATGPAPFALFVSLNNPHDIYHFSGGTSPDQPQQALPASWRSPSDPDRPELHHQFLTEDQGRLMQGSSPGDWVAYREFYARKVAAYDTQLGRILQALQDAGAADSTLVVATSDHGDMDGHHGLIFKGPFMYDPLVHVPLLIRPPAGPGESQRGTTRDDLTVNVDIVPTLLDYAGAPPAATDGMSLRPAVLREPDRFHRDFVISQYHGKQQWVNPMRMIRTHRHKLIVHRDQPDELYDLTDDPGEIRNLADTPGHTDTQNLLRTWLDDWIQQHNDPFPTLSPTDRQGRPVEVD